jgi:hypothetical protein
MKKEIELFISKIAKVIKGKNYLYCVCKKRYSCEFIKDAMSLRLQKPDSLIFVRHGNRFTFRDEFEGLNFKGLLIYGSLSKLIKKELVIYTFPELKKEVYCKDDAFALSINYVDNKVNFSLLKNNRELDLKIFLETGEEKEKQKNEYNVYNQTILDL